MGVSTLIWCEGDEETPAGWRLAGYEHFAPASMGAQVAHDCLEHVPGGLRHGRIADELMALGARFYTRVESGWWSTLSSGLPVRQQFGWEIFYLLSAIAEEGADVPVEIDQLVLPQPHVEDDIAGAFAFAEELEQQFRGKRWTDPRHYQASFVNWMRCGWRACVARYRGHSPGDVMGAVDRLTRLFDRTAPAPEAEGDLLQVVVDPRHLVPELRLV